MKLKDAFSLMKNKKMKGVSSFIKDVQKKTKIKTKETYSAVKDKRFLKWSLLALTALLLLSTAGYMLIVYGGSLVVDEEDLVLPARTVIETEDGETIKTLYQENRDPVSIETVPLHVRNAFVAIEDNRFYEHAGVDFKSVLRALYRDIAAMAKVEGASTITMQLSKNLFLHNDKTWMRKTKEVMAAIYLERNMSKDEILEYYLNEIYFAHGNYGIEAASQFYFSKPVQKLTIAEGALLAAMVKAPNNYSPIDHPEEAKARRNLVLLLMNEQEMIDTEERLALQGKTLGLDIREEAGQPWMNTYIDLIIQEARDQYDLSFAELQRGGYRITAAVEEAAQEIAYRAFQEEQFFPGSTEGTQGSFVLLDQETGEIEAAIGGRDYQTGNLNRVYVERQPGSVMKPLVVYGPAMMLEDYQPFSLLTDKKLTYDGYTAENYNGRYQSEVTMYEALTDSKNAPAVWLLDQIGIPYAKDYLEKLGIETEDSGLALALGGMSEGITPLEAAAAYRTFVHEGERIEPFAIRQITDRRGTIVGQADPESTSVFLPQVAWNMIRMLEGVVTDGTGKYGSYPGALAGKTGTTQHPYVPGQVKDAWFAGVTPEYALAAWIGYDTSDENRYLTGGSEAPTKLVKRILTELRKYKEMADQFEVPEGVEDLPEPVQLPLITDLTGSYQIGGFSLVKGELDWTPGVDDRVIYHIYRETAAGKEKVGETTSSRYTLTGVRLFGDSTFYVVPYDPLTRQEGKPSNRVQLTFGFTGNQDFSPADSTGERGTIW